MMPRNINSELIAELLIARIEKHIERKTVKMPWRSAHSTTDFSLLLLPANSDGRSVSSLG
jgi:hypothetical protein